jgi:hypothetical protein
MNTPERNNKNIDKLQKLDKVYSEASEDKTREKNYSEFIERATREYPLATTRKFAWAICGGFWLFFTAGMLFGVDFRPLFPFLIFSIGFVPLVHIPMFYVKKEMINVIIALIFSLSCIGVGVSLIVNLNLN